MAKTKGQRRAEDRRCARARMKNRDVIGQAKMTGNVVRRSYGGIIPDGCPTNYFEIGQDPGSDDAEEYGEAVFRALRLQR